LVADLRSVLPKLQPFKIKPLAIGLALPVIDSGYPQDQRSNAVPVVTIFTNLDDIAGPERRHQTRLMCSWRRSFVVAPQCGHHRALTLSDHSPAR
jgi:hypothetical protein